MGWIVMVAALVGLGSGALHAVSGPDHLLSLAPMSLGLRRRAWRVGLLWGLGHALGTVVCAAAVLAVASMFELELLSTWGDRLAGAALFVMGVVGLRRWHALRSPLVAAARASKNTVSSWEVLSIGLLHGVSGAAAVLLLLPAALAHSVLWKALYLGGFALGSTLAMAALTAALAASARALPKPESFLRHVPAVASFGSMFLGGWWVMA
jgi:nickel/cobalt exporter